MTGISAGSKTTYTTGASVAAAARVARDQTLAIAARELEVSPDDLDVDGDSVVVRGVPDRGIKLATIGKRSNTFASKIPPVLGASSLAFSVQAPAFAAELARLEIDPDTGEVTLTDFVIAQDVGKAINPLGIEGQMQGGAVQSLGFALTEGLIYDQQARLTNPSLLDYRKLTAADLPNLETVLVEVPAPARPLRGAWRGRAADRARPGGRRERRRGRHRPAPDRAAAHSREDRPGPGRFAQPKRRRRGRLAERDEDGVGQRGARGRGGQQRAARAGAAPE